MIYRILILLIVFSSTTECIHGQLIDPTTSFRNTDQKSYIRFHYDNDYFTKTDYYYSQGITLEYVNPFLSKFPLSKVLVTARNGNNTYGLTFNLFGYTPINTNSDSILYGDRPFSSALSIGYFSLSTDTVNNQRISSTLSLGLVGPLALGERIQTTIHRWLNNKLPRGWQHQVANDIIINYAINYEKKILTYKKMFLLNGVGQAKFGTLDIKISSGINFMAGYFNNPYKDRSSERKKKFELYLYGQGRVHAIGYNALLQGGLLNRNSPYTITNRNITRFVIQADAGIAMNFKKILLTYSRSYISKEFSPGKTHQWGGISIGAFF